MTNNDQPKNETLQFQSVDDLLGQSTTPEPLEQQMQHLSIQEKEERPPSTLQQLSENDQLKAKKIADAIPLNDASAMVTYGANAQNELSKFSHQMLNQVQANEIGPIGDTLNELMSKLSFVDVEELNPNQQRGFFQKIFKKAQKTIRETMSKYEKLGTQIDKITVQLNHSKEGLLQDVRQLDQLYEQNKAYFQALNIYIAAAEMKRDEIKNEILPKLKQKADMSGSQMDIQVMNDMVQFLDRLDKRLYDLQLSRQITIQTAPQIRMIQQTNQTLAEKIQSSVMTSIPLWKNQIAIALTLQNQQQAVESQKLVTKTTNDLLLKNSEMLKQNTIETAKENERGIIEIETLKTTQQNLIETIEETLTIQEDGRRKRQEAELELSQMEQELKTRLLSAYDRSQQS